MGNAGKRKEMVESRRVQQMYVEGRCVKGVYAIVCKSGVYVCVIESCMKVRVYVYACVYVCVVWPPKCMCYVCMCMCVCMNCRSRKESSSGTTNANMQAAAAGHLSSQILPESSQRKVKLG